MDGLVIKFWKNKNILLGLGLSKTGTKPLQVFNSELYNWTVGLTFYCIIESLNSIKFCWAIITNVVGWIGPNWKHVKPN